MTEHVHHLQLEKYEFGISRGTCACKAVKFFADDYNKETVMRVEQLNKELGCGPLVQIQAKKREETMEELKLLPPKPDLSGLSRMKKAKMMQRYYAEHKAQILEEFKGLPPEEQKSNPNKVTERWGISHSTWAVIRARWMPDRFQYPAWYGSKKKSTKEEVIKGDFIGSKTTKVDKSDLSKQKATKVDKGDHAVSASLPAFPAWNELWGDIVKASWLIVYGELARSK